MSFLEYNIKTTPTGIRKVLFINWILVILVFAVASIGFIMLYSVAGGSLDPWVTPQLKRFAMGVALMLFMAMVPVWFWRSVAGMAYFIALVLLVLVEFTGETGMGAQRWLNLGFMRLQPSELAKICLILVLAAYYDWLEIARTSRPLWLLPPLALIAFPTMLVLRQPDLGTSLLLIAGGGAMMFFAGVNLFYFLAIIIIGVGVVAAVFLTRGTEWQLLKNYQYGRIDTFLDPASDPLGGGYHITQSKIALGSGGWTGRGFMEGTQSRLNFLPEKHTDFIFTTLAEEFGFLGAASLLALYVLIIVVCIISAMRNKDRFSSLLILGVTFTFFLYFAVNMSMVMGLAPVVGVPLPLVSYGGSAMLVLLLGFGLVQSAHVHRARTK